MIIHVLKLGIRFVLLIHRHWFLRINFVVIFPNCNSVFTLKAELAYKAAKLTNHIYHYHIRHFSFYHTAS